MKTKVKDSNYAKALKRMEKETNRAIAHVKKLEEMYLKMRKANTRLP